MARRMRSAWAAVARRWRRSLRFRVVAGSVVGSTIVLGLMMPALLGRISAGVLGAKQDSALAEAAASRTDAQRLVDATSSVGEGLSPARRIDAVVAAVAARGGGGGLFEVLLLASAPAGLGLTPERGTNLVSESSIPRTMRTVVANKQRQAWAYTTIRYTNDESLPGLIVGAPLNVRGIGPYELYQLFPLTSERKTLDLVRNSTVVAGLLLVAGLAGLAAIVTLTFVKPVNAAARTARRLAGGDLEVRMPVRGEDDLAQLAVSFNDMAASLSEHIGAMRELSKVQRRFVADVSHELRTPLTTVRMAADLLHDRRQTLPPDEARSVELLQKQLNRFEALLADLLETSRADAGEVELDYQESDLGLLVGRVVASLEPLAAELATPVHVHSEPDLVVPCDPTRVERIIANLLANAIEHGQSSPVEIAVASDAGFPGVAGGVATVTVTDHGVGLAPKDLESVFTRFWRADPARARRIGGTGLGLSIALGDARAHGGNITVNGSPGRGATFVLCLPLHPAGRIVSARRSSGVQS